MAGETRIKAEIVDHGEWAEGKIFVDGELSAAATGPSVWSVWDSLAGGIPDGD